MSLLIKNGTLVTAKSEFKADIFVEDDKITAIGENLNYDAEEVVDASNKLIFPGGVDEHVHLGSFDSLSFETTNAAAVGGTTTVVDFPSQPKGLSIRESIKKANEENAKGKAMVDYSFHGMVMDPTEELIEEIPKLPEAGISTLKFFMGYKGTPFYSDDDVIFKALQKAKDAGVTIMVHAENGAIVNVLKDQLVAAGKTEPKYHAEASPAAMEAEATKRAIYLSKETDAPLFVVHVTNRESMEEIRDAYIDGVPVYGETCTHYLTLTKEKLAEENFEGAKYVCSPPLRTKEDNEALWEALNKNWLLSVGSDHAANIGGFENDKKKGIGDFTKIPPGCPGMQDRMRLLWTKGVEEGRISRQRFVDIACTTPAQICGLFPKKGQLAIGSDADIVIYNPDVEDTITVENSCQGTDYNTFEGMKVKGKVEKVYLRGKLTAENGNFVGEKGQGEYLKTKAYGLCFKDSK